VLLQCSAYDNIRSGTTHIVEEHLKVLQCDVKSFACLDSVH
jgi:hypothetical protein